jgi:NADH:ubiquinone oxidoreductase subunit 6 (subunit J)
MDWFARIGDHTAFYARAIAGVPHAAVHFRREIIRLIAEISMGAGTLAMIGGTVVIVGFLTLAAGGTLAVQGYSSLGNIGIEALTGFLAAFINVRISAPVVAGIGLAAVLAGTLIYAFADSTVDVQADRGSAEKVGVAVFGGWLLPFELLSVLLLAALIAALAISRPRVER